MRSVSINNKEVTLLEVSIFLKSAKAEVKFIRPTKLEKRPLFYHI